MLRAATQLPRSIAPANERSALRHVQELEELDYTAQERKPRTDEEFDVFMSRLSDEMDEAVDRGVGQFVAVITDPSCLHVIVSRAAEPDLIPACAVYLPSRRVVARCGGDPIESARGFAAEFKRTLFRKKPVCTECDGDGERGLLGLCIDCEAPVCDACVVQRIVETGKLSSQMTCGACKGMRPIARKLMLFGARDMAGRRDVWGIVRSLASIEGRMLATAFDESGTMVIVDAPVTASAATDPPQSVTLQVVTSDSTRARLVLRRPETGNMYVFDRRVTTGFAGDGMTGSERRWCRVHGCEELMTNVIAALRFSRKNVK